MYKYNHLCWCAFVVWEFCQVQCTYCTCKCTFNLVPLPFFELECICIVHFVFYSCIVDFRQTIPASNGIVCPGGKLQYTCTAVDELSWEIDSSKPVLLDKDTEINFTDTLKNFSLLLMDKMTTDTGIKIFTTATNDMVTSNLDGQKVVCYSATSHETLVIDVAGRVVFFSSWQEFN